jgi:hypothetical protein
MHHYTEGTEQDKAHISKPPRVRDLESLTLSPVKSLDKYLYDIL